MSKYRKKPVVIEAFRFVEDEEWPEWAAKAERSGQVVVRWEDDIGLDIKTLEGTMRAERGDWIIRGVRGELYPCKPDIFEATYEPAEKWVKDVAVRLDVDSAPVKEWIAEVRAYIDAIPLWAIGLLAGYVEGDLRRLTEQGQGVPNIPAALDAVKAWLREAWGTEKQAK